MSDYQEDVVLRDGSTAALRPARPADFDALLALAPDRFGPIKADGSTTVLAEIAGEAAGLATFAAVRGDDRRATIHVAVDTLARGLGLGTLLLEAAAAGARHLGIRTFVAVFPPSNIQMRRLLDESGFAIGAVEAGGMVQAEISLAPTAALVERHAERSQGAAAASMQAFFAPASVAVIGANRERGKIGSELLHNIVSGGYHGALYVVHPSADRIDGVPAHRSLAAIPGEVDLAVITVPAKEVPAAVDECVAKGVRALVIISAGFGETRRGGPRA